jgi:midasin (ATPase involved in ribosome maturation)
LYYLLHRKKSILNTVNQLNIKGVYMTDQNLAVNSIKYRVVVDNVVLSESTTKAVAELFITTLDPARKVKAILETVDSNGRQLLLG